MNDSLSSQQPPTSDDTPAQDTRVSINHLSSGARLLGWLACDGFQTLLVLMMLSAGQQKDHPGSWCRLPHPRGRRGETPGVTAGVCDELKTRKHLMMASGVRWHYLCFVDK